MRINSVIPQVNNNNNSKPSFGMVYFNEWHGWQVYLSKVSHEVVGINGAEFPSKTAEIVTKKYIELGEKLFEGDNFIELKNYLNELLQEIQQKLPNRLKEQDAKNIKKVYEQQNPIIKHYPTDSYLTSSVIG